MKKMLILIFFTKCASLETGKPQLGPELDRDQKAVVIDHLKGRPKYVRAYVYPQVLATGDITTGGPIHILVGYEHIDFKSIIED